MYAHIPQQWLLTVSACMVGILAVQLLDTLGCPKWAQWVGAAVIIVIAWVTFR